MSNSSGRVAAATNGSRTANLDASGLVETLQGHVDDLRSLLQCGICIRPLYEPFTIACGHTFCYSCLTSWFSGGRSKTCPDCRAPVKSAPAPAYLVRSLVQMFTSRAELLDRGETTTEHQRHQREEAEKLEQDKADTNPRTGGLFRGTFRPRMPIAQPIVDLEDNVVRCPICSWELEEDSGCAQCGYRQDARSRTGTSESGYTDTEENSEMTDYTGEVEDGFDDIDDDVWNDVYEHASLEALPFDLHQLHDLYHQHRMHDRFAPHNYPPPFYSQTPSSTGDDSEEDESDEDEDDEEMTSFIDDDEHTDGQDYDSESDRSTVVGDHGHRRQDRGYSTQDHEDDDDGQTSSDVSMSQDGEDVSDDDSDDDESIRGPTSRVARAPRVDISSSPSPSETSVSTRTSSSFSQAQSVVPRRGTQRNRSAQSSGSSARDAISIDDDSDEGPVGPTRRARDRRDGGSRSHGRSTGGSRLPYLL